MSNFTKYTTVREAWGQKLMFVKLIIEKIKLYIYIYIYIIFSDTLNELISFIKNSLEKCTIYDPREGGINFKYLILKLGRKLVTTIISYLTK